jgi:hypothetical protein
LLAIVDIAGVITKKITRDDFLTGTPLPTSTVTTAAIADDAVTAAKIDWASTGANGGIWWEELGRATAASGDTLSLTPISARKYLRVLIYLVPTGGTVRGIFRFNNDSSANYALRYSGNGGADTTAAAQSAGFINVAAAQQTLITLDIVNIAAQEKVAHGFNTLNGVNGAANIPNRSEGSFKWANTTDQITRIDVINDGTGDFASGTEIIVLGHN